MIEYIWKFQSLTHMLVKIIAVFQIILMWQWESKKKHSDDHTLLMTGHCFDLTTLLRRSQLCLSFLCIQLLYPTLYSRLSIINTHLSEKTYPNLHLLIYLISPSLALTWRKSTEDEGEIFFSFFLSAFIQSGKMSLNNL